MTDRLWPKKRKSVPDYTGTLLFYCCESFDMQDSFSHQSYEPFPAQTAMHAAVAGIRYSAHNDTRLIGMENDIQD